MATRLRQNVEFVAAPVGVTVLPHDINVDGVPQIPDVIWGQTDGTPVSVTATATEVALTNNSGGPVNVSCRLLLEHTVDRAWPGVPRPIVFIGSGSGAAGSGTWAFTYICTGAEGSDFFIPLPAVRANDNYIPTISNGGIEEILMYDCPDLAAPDRTTTQFRVVASAAVQQGDRIDVIITERTH